MGTYTYSPKKQRKCFQVLSAGKIMANVFWTLRELILLNVIQHLLTQRCVVKHCLIKEALQNKCWRKLSTRTQPIVPKSYWIVLDMKCLIIDHYVRICHQVTTTSSQ